MNRNSDLTLESQTLNSKHLRDHQYISPENDFDDLLRLASLHCNAPYAVLTIFEKERKWFKAKADIHFIESPFEIDFCMQTLHTNDIVLVEDTRADERFAQLPMVLSVPKIRFYLAIPIFISEGYRVGNLCVLDTVARTLSKDQIFGLEVIAKQLMQQLEFKLQVLDLTKSIGKIHKQNKELKRLNLVSNKLISIISHDLRSPMTTLKGFIEVSNLNILDQIESIQFRKGITEMLNSTLDLMENLIQWGSMHMKESRVVYQPLQLDSLIQEVISHLQLITLHKKNSVICHLSEPYMILGDHVMLKFIIRNLLQNANKFTDEGVIEITVTQNDQFHKISIKDSGVGMKKEQIINLFNWSKRISTRGTVGEKGAGIGLMICKEFVEKHGGTLEGESTFQKGSIFSFTLSKDL
ncbi:GAF domain-containing sensor histidine kinase [Catalinimonas alkaloidigena]|uniref:GAF domain-containing sensor histidine kinase n=1 Tax=Catalinimonas alkaloidigena TaxID=1075417 RepID=UPI002405B557|nr:GAF domain-containing sensor histidine kinase [Catalinimonas alkaloidigena]